MFFPGFNDSIQPSLMHLYCYHPWNCIHGNGQIETKAGLPHTEEWAKSWPQQRQGLFKKKKLSSSGTSEWQAKQVPTSGIGNSIYQQPQEWQGNEKCPGHIQETGPDTSYLWYCHFCQMPALWCRSEVWPGAGWETGLETGTCLTELRQEPSFCASFAMGCLGRDVGPRSVEACWRPPGPDNNNSMKTLQNRLL